MNIGFMESRGYIFKSVLGKGTYSKVVKAYSTRLKKTVAIKVLDMKKDSPSYLEKFLPREIDIIRSLSHPNIVATHDIFKQQEKTVIKDVLIQFVLVLTVLQSHYVSYYELLTKERRGNWHIWRSFK